MKLITHCLKKKLEVNTAKLKSGKIRIVRGNKEDTCNDIITRASLIPIENLKTDIDYT